jgi:hypothetical protein
MSGYLKFIWLFLAFLLLYNNFSIPQEEGEQTNIKDSVYTSPEQFGIWAGWFLPNFQSQAQVNSQMVGLGPIVNLERAFKLPDSENLLRIESYFRINNNHSVYAGFYTSSREGLSKVTNNIQFGNLIIPIGAEAYSKNDISLLKVGYRYSLVNSEEIESGFGLGFSILFYYLFVENKLLSRENTEEVDVALPIPIINFFSEYHIWNKFDLTLYIDMFGVNFDIYDGVLLDFALNAKYKITDQFAVGIGYNIYKIDVRVENPKGFDGKIDYLHKGFAIFASAVF